MYSFIRVLLLGFFGFYTSSIGIKANEGFEFWVLLGIVTAASLLSYFEGLSKKG